jgi:transposase
MARRTRRLWTDEGKRSICLRTTAPGVSVARVALRHAVNATPIFKWLRDPGYRPKPGTGSEEAGLRLLPVEIVKEAPVIRSMPAADHHIETDLADGHRMRIRGSHDPEALARLIRGLTA